MGPVNSAHKTSSIATSALLGPYIIYMQIFAYCLHKLPQTFSSAVQLAAFAFVPFTNISMISPQR